MPDDPDIRRHVDAELERLRTRPPDLAFSPSEYAARTERLRDRMAADGLDLVLLTSPDAICWLHGYRARWYRAHASTRWPPIQITALAVDAERPIHFDSVWHADLVRLTSAAEDVRLVESRRLDDWTTFLVRELRAAGCLRGRVGVERASCVPNPLVAAALESAVVVAGCEVVDATAAIRAVRRVKSPAEIALVERAAAVCDHGLETLREALRPEMTELEAWGVMMAAISAAGGEPAGIHECVVAGPVQLGHAISSTRRVGDQGYVFADPSGVVYRYHANTARTIFLDEPPAVARRIAEIEAGAFDVLAGIAFPGTPVRDVNAALRRYYEEAGVYGLRAWTGGYELGISFPPDWVGEWLFTVDDENPEEVIEAGMVTNYESIVLYPMIDTVVYEVTGPRFLSMLPRQLLVAG